MLGRLDANKDGAISRAEASQMPAERFSKIDRDQNGVITQTEAAEGAKKHQSRRAAGEAKRQERLAQRGKAGQNPKRGQIAKHHRGEKHLAKLDTNNDGQISQQEYFGAPHPLMKLDTNHDRRVDASELAAQKNKGGKNGAGKKPRVNRGQNHQKSNL